MLVRGKYLAGLHDKNVSKDAQGEGQDGIGEGDDFDIFWRSIDE